MTFEHLKKQAEISADALEHCKLKEYAQSLRMFISQAESNHLRLQEHERRAKISRKSKRN